MKVHYIFEKIVHSPTLQSIIICGKNFLMVKGGTTKDVNLTLKRK